MPSYKLYYFPIRGFAEIFAYAGVDNEDIRLSDEEWEDFKHKTPFGKMPVLEVDGKMLPQSVSIARYLAKQFGLAGSNAWESAWVDAIADQYTFFVSALASDNWSYTLMKLPTHDYCNDIRDYFYALMGYETPKEGDTPEALENLKQKVGIPARDKFFKIIVKQLKENGTGFLVGSSVTWIDFIVADDVSVDVAEIPGFLDDYPEVIEHAKRIHALPAIAKWIEKRPVTRD